MNFIADFHIHSKYSRATARNLDFENLYINAQIKGITVLGTGDFTHPAWWQEIQDKLIPAEEGLFKLKPDIARACDEKVPPSCRRPVRFMLVTEISNIYKKKDRTRKNHNLVFLPDLDSATQFNRRLDDIGNIQSDGRPILGLDARNLLEIVLETTESGYLVPAHIWTPWFSLLGSKSGFDTVDECFEDLTSHIFALETGLSSDPAMNHRISHLDRYTLISNSDAHSPSKLGREANHFNTELSYFAIRSAMETADPDQFLGTIEFYPEEGKYHVDGHRKCQFRSDPAKTRALDGICPVCGNPLTLGVLYRVEELADREYGASADKSSPYINLIPLEDVLSEVFQVGVKTKKVNHAYHQLILNHGSEFDILCHVPKASLEKNNIPLLAEAVVRMREGRILFDPGYDGEFGRVRIFNPSERDTLQGQQCLFDIAEEPQPNTQKPMIREPIWTGKKNLLPPKQIEENCIPLLFSEPQTTGYHLNEEQQAAVDYDGGSLLICAGPGTGKTRTITCKMAALIEKTGIGADQILAVTFTNKASQEMRHRLENMLPPGTQLPTVATFHGFCWLLLQELYDGQTGAIVDDTGRRAIIEDAIEMANTESAGQAKGLSTEKISTEKIIDQIIRAKQQLLGPDDDLGMIVKAPHTQHFKEIYTRYQRLMTLQELFDFEDLLFRVVKILEEDKSWKNRVQKRISYIFVDEFQDINDIQYRLLRVLASPKAQVCVIGDPDQAIYGFRGSNVAYFKKFIRDYKKTRVIRLARNYRSTETLLAASFQVIENHRVKLLEDDQARTYSGIKEGPSFISVVETTSAQAEAVAIGRTIEQMVGGTGFHSIDFEKLASDGVDKEYGFADFAILCRTGDQVQTISRKLVSACIPCQMVSRRTLQQPVIAKLLAAFRVVTGQGAYADVNLLTNLGAPGISKETLRIFKQWAYARQLPLATALYSAHRLPIPKMSAGRQQRLVALVRLLERLENECADLNTAGAINHIALETTLSSKVTADDLDRLTTLARPYGHNKKAFGCALAIDIDTDLYQPGVEKVSVMTLHAAKGLEFPVVFIAGCEDRMIPYLRPEKQDVDVEEERRLLYVGMTRAGRQLYLTWARRRSIYGQSHTQHLSPFVQDIDKNHLRHLTCVCKHQKPKQEQLFLF